MNPSNRRSQLTLLAETVCSSTTTIYSVEKLSMLAGLVLPTATDSTAYTSDIQYPAEQALAKSRGWLVFDEQERALLVELPLVSYFRFS